MGTGSFGGGGGGGGGGLGSGGLGPSFQSSDGKPVSVAPNLDVVSAEVTSVFKKLNKDYIAKQFGSDLIRSIFEELFVFGEAVKSANPCAALKAKYGVSQGEGFLQNWVSLVMKKYSAAEPNVKVRDVARMTIDGFLTKAIGDDEDLYLDGTCQEVVAKIDRNIFHSTSGHFLGLMIWRVVEREYERQQPRVQVRFEEAAQKLANGVIEAFKGRFVDPKNAEYKDFFRVVQENPDWFVQELKK